MQENLNRREALGPAETIIQTLLTHTDHCYHGRPGIIVPDRRTKIGVRWDPVTYKKENGEKVVYKLSKVGKIATPRAEYPIFRINSLRFDFIVYRFTSCYLGLGLC